MQADVFVYFTQKHLSFFYADSSKNPLTYIYVYVKI